jgi:putative endopeptidase
MPKGSKKHKKEHNNNKTKKQLIDTQQNVKELCASSGFNTFEGKLFRNMKNNEEVDKVIMEYRKYKNNLKTVITSAGLVSEHRKDDYFSYINDDWIHKQEEKLKKELKYYSQVDNFRIVQEKVYYEVMGYVNDYIKNNSTSKKAKLIENVYKALYKTTKTIGLKNTHKVKDDVERFIKNKDMYGLLAHVNSNEIYSWAAPIVWNVLPDEKNVSQYISHLSPPQLGIYDLYIYIDDPSDTAEKKKYKKEFKSKYFKFINDTFKIVLPDNHHEFNAQDVWDVEVDILNAMGCSDIKKEDPNFYNVITKEQLEKDYDFDWTQFTKKLGYKKPPPKVISSSLNSLKCITRLMKENWDSPKWKTYWLFIFYKTMLRFEWDWNQTYYDFYAHYVQGQPVRFPKELYPIFMLAFTFNTFLSEQYIDHNKNPLYINYVTNLVTDMKKIFINRIKRNNWLSPSTKKSALHKLEKLELIVGSPPDMREDPLLEYSPNDPWHNMNLLAEWRHNKLIEYDGGPVGIDIPEIDWNELKLVGTQPYVVNAYYRPTSNSIYVPLAFLQKPFIDLDERGIEYNLAFVGYTMGHELSHCLDDMGSKFDAKGNLKNWWTPRDRRIFKQKIKDVVAQYEEFAARDGIHFDAEIGVGENLADISGLSLAEEYLLLFQQANEDIDIIKKISLEAFYVYSAIQSRQKIHDKAIPAQLKTNPHPLEKYRCNCPLSRLDLFRTIYNVKKGDGMWWHNTDTIW